MIQAVQMMLSLVAQIAALVERMEAYSARRDDAPFRESDHPRDNDGKFTAGGGGGGAAPKPSSKTYRPAVRATGARQAAARKQQWQLEAPKTVAALYETAQANQDALAKAADAIARRVGTAFKNPGIKGRKRLTEKLRNRKANRITDVVRGGFDAATPADGDRIVKLLGEKFEVADEGWQKTPAGYFDRKVMVRFEDGSIGEIQLWPPGMLEAKEKGGGHKLYEKWRSLDPGSPDAVKLNEEMKAFYAKVEGAMPETWRGVFSRPKQPAASTSATSP